MEQFYKESSEDAALSVSVILFPALISIVLPRTYLNAFLLHECLQTFSQQFHWNEFSNKQAMERAIS